MISGLGSHSSSVHFLKKRYFNINFSGFVDLPMSSN